MESRLRFDDEVDADIIAEIKKMANGGPISKALYRIVLEWYFLRENHFVPKNIKPAADQGEPAADQGQNDKHLASLLSGIDKDW
jgi:hypothetical protein